MLKIRSILFGVISSVLICSLLIIITAFLTDKSAALNERALSNVAYIELLASVFVGGLLSAFSAKGRGLLYGLMVAAVWLLLSLVMALSFQAESLLPIALRWIGILPAGIIGGGVGILLSNKNEYM